MQYHIKMSIMEIDRNVHNDAIKEIGHIFINPNASQTQINKFWKPL